MGLVKYIKSFSCLGVHCAILHLSIILSVLRNFLSHFLAVFLRLTYHKFMLLKHLGILPSSLALVCIFLMGCSSSPIQSNYREDPHSERARWVYVDNSPVSSHVESNFGDVPEFFYPRVEKWVNYFTHRGRRHMKRYLERSTRYLPIMKSILREQGLPEDLAYLQFVESGFSPSAYSSAAAVGYWQFIRGTGKNYDLEINAYKDERRDPILSTYAASNYFRALYSLFGDWYLAMAAYNCGESRVKRTVMKYKTRDYFELVKRRKLPRETSEYVPKLLAAIQIAQDPQKYGFTHLNYQPLLSYDEVHIPQSISLHKWAGQMGVPYKEIQSLNPLYRTDYVPVKKGSPAVLRVPEGMEQKAQEVVAKSLAQEPRFFAKGTWSYKVRRGDTLSSLAVRYGTSVRRLKSVNNLGRKGFLVAGRKIRIPHRGSRYFRKHSRRTLAQARKSSKKGVHKVRRGQTLSGIARTYKVSVQALRRLNGLGRSSLIKAGQVLKVPTRLMASRSFHKVSRGENLSSIAAKYGLSLGEILTLNKLSRRSVIYPGQSLRLTKGY